MRIASILLSVLLLVQGVALGEAPSVVEIQMTKILRIPGTNVKHLCYIVPILQGLVTANHCVDEDQVPWEGQGQRGVAYVVERDTKRDLAFLRIEGATLEPLVVAKQLPKVTEKVWYLYFFKGDDSSVLFEGTSMGRHEAMTPFGFVAARFFVFGAGGPGTSGSPLVNSRGELVGLVTGGWIPTADPVGSRFTMPLTAVGILVK